MALDKQGITKRTRHRLYGAGLGEKPTIVSGTGNAAVSGSLATFDVAAGKGATLRAGHIITAYDPAANAAYGFYITDISTDTLTTINGYSGDSIANAAAVPSLLEVNAPVPAHVIHEAIDEIINGYLWPEVFDIVVDSFTPNQSTFQSNANALDERIIRGWQKSGNFTTRIPIELTKNVGTVDFASGKMISYDTTSGNDIYYTVLRRVSLANSTANALNGIIAKGAAALVSESVALDGMWESSRKDAQERSDRSPADRLWQSFHSARRQYSEDLSRDTVGEFTVNRG